MFHRVTHVPDDAFRLPRIRANTLPQHCRIAASFSRLKYGIQRIGRGGDLRLAATAHGRA
jgi:hypothetical protein